MRNFGLLIVLLVGCKTDPLETKNLPEPERHRPVPTMCPTDRPAGSCGASSSPFNTCQSDADCTAGTNGRCNGNSHDGCSCSYDECGSDSACGAGTLCDCRDDWHYGTNGPNRCLPSNCRVDSDCGSNGFCSPSLDADCGRYFGVTGWFCHTPNDECHSDSDCAADLGCYGQPFCAYFPEVGHWACSATQCAG